MLVTITRRWWLVLAIEIQSPTSTNRQLHHCHHFAHRWIDVCIPSNNQILTHFIELNLSVLYRHVPTKHFFFENSSNSSAWNFSRARNFPRLIFESFLQHFSRLLHFRLQMTLRRKIKHNYFQKFDEIFSLVSFYLMRNCVLTATVRKTANCSKTFVLVGLSL